jgi:hypothetical protein
MKNRAVVVLGVFLVLASGLGMAQTSASCSYTTFVYPGSGGTTATGINDYNTVVGYTTVNGALVGFIRWSNGTFTKVNVPGSSRTLVLGRNNNGVSVGQFQDAQGQHGFLLTSNGYQTVNYVSTSGTELLGINNYNSSVGDVRAANGQFGFKRWSNGSFTKVQYPNSNGTQINGINDSGVMVGMSAADAGPGTMLAFALINGKFQQIIDPAASGLSTWVNGINDNQVIVGTGYSGNPPRNSHGFFIVNGQVKEMPTPSGASNLQANGINKSGLIVGTGTFAGMQKGFIAKCQ